MFGNTETDHVMLTSRGANLFAESIGIKTVPTDTLVTEYEKREWEKQKKYITGVKELFNSQWYVMYKMGHDLWAEKDSYFLLVLLHPRQTEREKDSEWLSPVCPGDWSCVDHSNFSKKSQVKTKSQGKKLKGGAQKLRDKKSN